MQRSMLRVCSGFIRVYVGSAPKGWKYVAVKQAQLFIVMETNVADHSEQVGLITTITLGDN